MEHPCQKHNQQPEHPTISRREFLGTIGVAAASLVAAGCRVTTSPATALAPAVTSRPNSAGTAAGKPLVALAQANSYDPATVRKQVRSMLDALGGLKGVVHSGDRVAIKVNLTGGISTQPLPGVSAIESYITHPEVVRALGEAVLEAGAKELNIVEAVYEDASWQVWGYQDMAKALGARLIDLNNTWPYNDFVQLPVGNGAFIYPNFNFNRILQECDVFMSVPKMKCHNTAGITLSMKNLFGTAPMRFYRSSEQDNYRSGFHGAPTESGTRVPHIIVDLNRARPVNFALIDAIKTTEGGEGPWITGMAPVDAGVLLAGINPLATDTVAAAVMGFDATAAPMAVPFVHGDNHLAIAASVGLGTNKLSEIQTTGPAIKDLVIKFKPSY